ncbi:hypothetical protein C84B14_13579 [Salinisphaera sp. C84B14]|uniref:hypothetical protein n=1 Tax=Salinisphaera sp. C84B14 TaxID=1304155 RepID=UPI0033417AD4
MANKFKKWFKPPKVYQARLPSSPASAYIVFVGSDKRGFGGQGKLNAEYFLPKFEFGAQKAGVATHFYISSDVLVQNLHAYHSASIAVIFVYNEEHFRSYPSEKNVAAIVQRPNTLVFNAPASGRLIAFKTATNELLAARGVDVPKMVESSIGSKVFSNAVIGSQTPTEVLDETCDVDASRYNTELIDTRYEYMGNAYYVCLRALCVGPKLVDLYIRCRPVSEGSPNVHSGDTPLDPELLNAIYNDRVSPRLEELETICASISDAVGPCFFAHDILLGQNGRLAVCEVGWKFDDSTLRKHLWPISGALDFMQRTYTGAVAESAGTYVAELVSSRDASDSG